MGLFEKGAGRSKSPWAPGAVFLTELWFRDRDHTALGAAERAAFLCTWTSLIIQAPLETGLFPNSPGTISVPPCSKKGRQPQKRERERSAGGTHRCSRRENQRKEALSFFRTLNPEGGGGGLKAGAKAEIITMITAHIYCHIY